MQANCGGMSAAESIAMKVGKTALLTKDRA